MNIYEKLVDIQGRLKAPKNQYNSFGKYKYRNCEDILEAVKPLLVEHKLVLTISDDVCQDNWGDKRLVFVDARARITDGKDTIEVNAQAGVDPNRKGMDIAQSFGSSSSYARKYALNGLFLIDDTKDADSTNTHDGKPEKELDWLPDTGVKFENAKKAIQEGYTISDIRKKYKVSKKVEQLLNQ